MPLWGRNDQSVTANSSTTKESSNGAPIGTSMLVKAGGQNTSVRVDAANAHFGNTSSGSRAAVDVTMFGNTTTDAYIPGKVVGVFGLDTTEINVSGGSTNGIYRVTSGGTGYGANAAVTVTFANGVSNTLIANSFANSTTNAGRITSVIANGTQISSLTGADRRPTVTIAAPAAITLNANTTSFEPTGSNSTFSANTNGVTTNTFIAVSTANTAFPTVGQKVVYRTPAGNTVIAPLANNGYYFIAFSNTTVLSLANTLANALANTPIANLNPQTAALTGALAPVSDVILVTSANSRWQVGDQLTYIVPTSNTAVPPLTANGTYYVSFANTSSIALSATSGGANISFSPSAVSTETHSIQGLTATALLIPAGARFGGATHAGWVLRTEGTGGRAGRVHYETLVAMGSLGNNNVKYGTAPTTLDASDDAVLPDA